MSDLIIEINKKTRKVTLNNIHIGNDHENLQENLVFQFDEFVDGQARLEYEINETKNYIILQKENETYTIPVQNVITIYQEQTKGKINFQLVITEGTEEENIPVFKSNIFFLICRPSINAVTEAPEGYDLWIEQANAKLNAMDEALREVDNLDIDANKVGKVTSIIITKKDGTQETINVDDGVSLEYLWQGTSLGIKREEVYIANIVKCRPPSNRNPEDDEAMACLNYLRNQVILVKPKIIVLLGSVALKNILGKEYGITASRGTWIEKNDILYMPTWHPAALLRDETKKIDFINDLKLVLGRNK